MKINYLLLVMFILGSVQGLFAEKIAELNGIEKPTDLLCAGQNIYIMDGANVKVFGLSKGEFKFKFARKGEGPGEIKMSPFQTNTLTPHNDNIAIDSLDRVIFYSTYGEFKREVKKGRFLAVQVKPVSRNYVVKRIDRSDNKTEYITLDVYDRNMNKLKEIARQRSSIQFDTVRMIPDSIHFYIKNERIYVERSDKGTVIEVFDTDGNPLRTLKFSSAKTIVTETDKNSAMNRYKNDSLVKQIGFENLKKRISFEFPKYFPEIANVSFYKNNIIIKTYARKNGKILYKIIDLNGKIISRVFLPKTWEGEMIAHLNGVEPELYTFHDGYFYYLFENYDTEEFELHRVKI